MNSVQNAYQAGLISGYFVTGVMSILLLVFLFKR